jgi:hypothetical protein
MKLYTLTYIYYKSPNIGTSLQSNILLFSDKYDKIEKSLYQQKDYILQHLKETHDCTEILTETVYAQSNEHSGYIIKANNNTYMLLVSAIETEVKTPQDINLNPGDFATLFPEALEVLKQDNSKYGYFDPYRFKIVKILSIKDNKASVMVIGVDNNKPNDTSGLTATCTLPVQWLKRIYV